MSSPPAWQGWIGGISWHSHLSALARAGGELGDLAALVVEHGWAVRHAPWGETALSHSVGLTLYGHPEIVTCGLPPDTAQALINALGEERRDEGRTAAPGVREDLTSDGTRLALLPVADTSGLGVLRELFTVATALQLVWSDSDDHLPWEHGWRLPEGAQPLLGDFQPLL